MTEALAVVDSLRAASQLPTLTNESSLTLNTTLISNTDRKVLPLKMALFNLQKYIKEGEFVVEFMLKGGLKLLMALLERSSGGLTGNSLAVCQPCYFVLISVRSPRSSRSPRVRVQLGRHN
jgi:engulfment/cell motility protein 1